MNRDFKGIWIPREIWLDKTVSLEERCLWAEIHSLYNRERGGCFASNEYLAKFLGCKERRVQELIASLKQKGLLTQVSFDGRTRVLRAIAPAEDVSPEESTDQIRGAEKCTPEVHGDKGVEPNPSGVHSRGAEKCTPGEQKSAPLSYIYNDREQRLEKREREGGKPPAPPTPPRSAREDKKIPYGIYVVLKEGEYETLCKSLGQGYVDYYIKMIDAHVPNAVRTYKDFASAIRSWYTRDHANGKLPTLKNGLQERLQDAAEAECENREFTKATKLFLKTRRTDERYLDDRASEAEVRHLGKDYSVSVSYRMPIEEFRAKLLDAVEVAFPGVKSLILAKINGAWEK